MKPMTQGQIDLHEIAMSAEATEAHLRTQLLLIILVRKKIIHLIDAFLIGLLCGLAVSLLK